MDFPYKRELGRENDRRPSSKPADTGLQQRVEGVAAGADLREVRDQQAEPLLTVAVREARRQGEPPVLLRTWGRQALSARGFKRVGRHSEYAV